MTPCYACSTMSASLFCPSCGTRKSAQTTAAAELVRVYEGPEGTLVQTAAVTAPRPVALQAVPPPPVHMHRTVETVDIRNVSGNLHHINQGGVTTAAIRALHQSDEQMAWSEKPSPFLLLPLGLKYFAALCALTYFTRSIYAILFLLFIAAIHAGLRFLEINGTTYRLSSQRLEVTAGLFNQTTVTYENFRLGDAVIVRPLYLRLFQCANVHIAGAPTLTAIRQPEVVRDIVREFGQTEASRTDKVRWRN